MMHDSRQGEIQKTDCDTYHSYEVFCIPLCVSFVLWSETDVGLEEEIAVYSLSSFITTQMKTMNHNNISCIDVMSATSTLFSYCVNLNLKMKTFPPLTCYSITVVSPGPLILSSFMVGCVYPLFYKSRVKSETLFTSR